MDIHQDLCTITIVSTVNWITKIIFSMDTFPFQDQISAVEEESDMIAGSEVEALRQTIADKDREIAELSGELQTL